MGYVKLPTEDKILNKCGKNYFLSKIIVEDNKYYFQDVLGCSKNSKNPFSCSKSVKNSGENDFYKKVGIVDEKTQDWLSLLEDGKVYFLEDLSKLSDKETIKIILNSTINKIDKAWIKVERFSTIIDEQIKNKTQIKIITSINNDSNCEVVMSKILDNL